MKTVTETAEMFGVSRNAVYKWLRSGLKHSREKIIGKNVRIIIDPAEVYAFHKAKETPKNNKEE